MIEDQQYLAFVDFIGTTIDGQYRYRLDFSQAPEVVWGEDWNSTPAGIIPNIAPDANTLSITGEIVSGKRYLLAKENTCFSMQDCIDGIIPLLFSDVNDSDTIVLPFGMKKEDVEESLSQNNIVLENIKRVNEEKDNAVINSLINTLEQQNDDRGENNEQ